MIELTPSNYHRKRLIVAAAVCIVLAGIIKWSTQFVFATDSAVAPNEKIITVHDSGTQKGLVTNALTLREAFQQANIRIDTNDITEPTLDEPLTASSYEANIYRARPVVIKDANKQTTIVTAYRTGKQIAKQANITLGDQDITTLSPAKDIIADGAAEVMTIDRATPVTLVFYGQTISTSTRANTIGDMIKEKNITPAADDTLSTPVGTAITAGMSVELWKNGKQTATVEEAIAFTTRQVQDANQPKGYKQVQTAGTTGKRTVTYEITMQNNKEVSRTVVNSVTTKEPTEQVEVVGTKVDLPAGSHTDWMAQAGISPGDYGYVDYIVGRESGWSPTKYNYAGSGAYGLCQSLPASKMATAGGDYMTNPITQLKWCNSYAVGRYGSWAAAYNFWISRHWW